MPSGIDAALKSLKADAMMPAPTKAPQSCGLLMEIGAIEKY